MMPFACRQRCCMIMVILIVSTSKVADGLSLTSTTSLKRGNSGTLLVPTMSLSSSLTSTSFTKSTKSLYHNQGSSALWSMHMGHSHAHHHHHHHDHGDNDTSSAANQSTPSDPGTAIRRFRRKAALFVFAALAILGPPIFLKRRALARADWVAFGLTSVALSSLETLRREFGYMISKFQRMRKGVVKHTFGIATEEMSTTSNSAVSNTPEAAAAASGNSPRFSAFSNIWKYLFQNDNPADRVTLVGVVVNLILSVGKFFVGVTCHSSALVADAGHSLSDLFSDFVTLYSVQLARLPPDDDHPYGHGKFEAIGSLFLSLTLLGTGISVGAVANKQLLKAFSGAATAASLAIPTPPALIMAALSIASKEWLFRVTAKVGEELNSQVVIANAWHHRSDAYSSVLALLSIGLAMFVPGWGAADSFAGLLVAGMICMTGAEILGESITQLTDTVAPEKYNALLERVTDTVEQTSDVLEVKKVQTRPAGLDTFITDVSVVTTPGMSSSALLNLEERIKISLLQQEPTLAEVTVHAASVNSVVCPLLLKEEEKNGVAGTSRSVAQLETLVRMKIGQEFPAVAGVPTVTVHYHDTVFTNVDVTIQVKNEAAPLTDIYDLSTDISSKLETDLDVNHANIYLDLNPSTKEKVDNNDASKNIESLPLKLPVGGNATSVPLKDTTSSPSSDMKP